MTDGPTQNKLIKLTHYMNLYSVNGVYQCFKINKYIIINTGDSDMFCVLDILLYFIFIIIIIKTTILYVK